jgi:hypothetical protein
MSTAAKKQKNREYYLKNREKILNRARERNNSRRDHLEIVPNEYAQSEKYSGTASNSARTSEKIHQPSNVSEEQSRSISAPGSFHTNTADHALALFDVAFEVSSSCFDNSFASSDKGAREQTQSMVEGMPLKRKDSDSENTVEDTSFRKTKRIFRKMPLSFMLRLLLVACLTLLMTAMQVEFYLEHDILPGYAVPLALASEVAFLSLVSMKFSRSLDWLRIAINLIFFGYFVSALSFHVYAKSRLKAASQPSVAVTEITEIGMQLKQAERSLDAATRGRAWKNMEIFGAEVSKLRKQLNERPKAQVLGTSSDQTLWIEAILLILLRALLLATSALNMLRVRVQTYEMTEFNRLVT